MLSDKAVFNEFAKIRNAKLPAAFWHITAAVIIGGVRTVKLLNLAGHYSYNNYLENTGPLEFIVGQVGAVSYKELIYPHQGNLVVRLIFKMQSDLGKEIPTSRTIIRDYDAYMVNPQDLDLLSTNSANTDLVTLESSNLIRIKFQLVDKMLNEMRVTESCGIYRNASAGTVLKSCLSFGLRDNSSVSALTKPGYEKVRGVDLIPPTNSEPLSHVIIPYGVRLTKLAKYLQKEYGIYGAGIGCYFTGGLWYVFPPFDYTRFSKEIKTLTVVNMPANELRGVERTFMRNGDHLIIFSTGDTKMVDASENILANAGDGIAFTKSSDIETGMATTSKNITTPTKAWKTLTTDKRENGIQNLRYTENRFTDNPYNDLSMLAMGNGRTISLQWENSFAGLLYPGMPVRVLYMRNSSIERLDGTLIANNTITTTTSGRLTDRDYRATTNMVVHVKKRS